ncbi:MAG: DUF5683 domain-containing protein [Candidatus Aminicenantes bacterium]|jgi:hypothetical protein
MKRGLVTILVFLVLAFSFLPCAGQEVAPEESSQEKKITSLHKSLLLPGWGQLAEKRYVEGIIFLSAEIFALYKVFSYNHKGNRAYARYKDATSVADAVAQRQMTEDYDKKRNQYLLVAAGVWAVNLIDIYFIMKNKDHKGKNLRLKLESGKNKSLALTVSYRF